jgi:hypothetical protein
MMCDTWRTPDTFRFCPVAGCTAQGKVVHGGYCGRHAKCAGKESSLLAWGLHLLSKKKKKAKR